MPKAPTTAKTTTTKTTPKGKVEPKPTKPVVAKTDTAPKRKPMPDGKSVNAQEEKREPKWNERRVALVKAMRALGAVNYTTAVTA